ncbi:TetR/AcrR family transcriptional regulator [Leifsonia sp. NPDC058292]|uniref:TetR/AcrR family transcriptional regulator n=1 Tax=Leifsonia sp. NPDC058292 TaxID=3346428 RepID=UPI0036DCAA5E
MDARQQKTKARLSETILALATAGPVAEVTVSRLAAEAGVHRSTVYAHAESPADLLGQVLRGELDVLRAEYLLDVPAEDAGAAISGVTRAVLHHVDAHDAIYRRGLGEQSGSASLHAMLSRHFEGSIDLLLDQHSVAVPATSEAERRTIARYLADGIIGAIEVWLAGDRPRDVDALLALLARVAPSWWPSTSR